MSWKSEKVWITENTTTTSVTGSSSGQVTCQKRCQALAPSSAAASWRSGLIVCSPASSVMAKNGIPRQVLTSTAHHIAQSPSDKNGNRSVITPEWNSSQFITLNVGSNIQRQANADSTVGMMNGSSIEARMIRLKRKLRFNRSASHMPSANLKIVAQNV